jgi:hypothetical protein
MSFGEFMFLVGFIQKTAKEDLNIKRDSGIISWLLCRNVLEDTTPRQGMRPCQVGPASSTPRPLGLPWWETPMSFLESSSTTF